MLVDLETDELFYLLDNCLRGSHLRSGTIERFVNQWYDIMNEKQRMCLFEWAVRLSYAWNGCRCFEPQSASCGQDVIFMKRFHPENQYNVTTKYNGKEETHRAFLMDGKYYVGSTRQIAKEFIVKVEKLEFADWKNYKQHGIDYDKNILE